MDARDLRAVAFSPDATLLYSASEEDCVTVWRVSDGSLLRLLVGHQGEVMALAVNAAGTVYSASDDGTVIMWSGVDGAIVDTLEHDRQYAGGYGLVAIMSMALGPDGAVYGGLNSASNHPSEVCRWYPRTGRRHTFEVGVSEYAIQGSNAMAVGANNVLYTAITCCGGFSAW
jgi:WD40 repeat protein